VSERLWQRLGAACNWPFPLAPEPVCPQVFAGESPGMVLYALVIVPLLLVRGGARTVLTIAVLSLVFALVQLVAALYTVLPSTFERDPATCGLVLCGLDHSLFHFAQAPFLLVLAFFSYRAYRAPRGEHERGVPR
jgi:hypothetical protein